MGYERTAQELGPDGGDVALAFVKGAVEAVPFIGGAVSEVLALALQSPLERRRNAFLTDVAAGLDSLTERVEGLSLEALVDREEFVTVIVVAAQMSLRTHQRVKLDALRNAVLNVAMQTSGDEPMIDVHLATIDGLSVLHLQFLLLIKAHALRVKSECKDSDDVAVLANENVEVMKALAGGDDELYSVIMKDLQARSLTRDADADLPNRYGNTTYYHSPTRLGFSFLRLIEEPAALGTPVDDDGPL